jgi:hypothetical protein
MEIKSVAIICIWAFMIALLILNIVKNMDFLVTFFLFFIALIVTIYLASSSGKDKNN